MSSLFQCQPATDRSVFTPNIPDFYFNHTNTATLLGAANLIAQTDRTGVTFVYTTPPEPGCTGILVALQYCYQARVNDIGSYDQRVFRFLSLRRDALQLTVENRITAMSLPQDNICSVSPGEDGRIICCDTTTLSKYNQLNIKSSNYTFGVVILNGNIQPLAFNKKHQFPHFRTRPSGNGGPSVGATFGVTVDELQSDATLLLLRLIIGKLIIIIPSQ